MTKKRLCLLEHIDEHYCLTFMTATGTSALGVFPPFGIALPPFSLLKAALCKHPTSLLGEG